MTVEDVLRSALASDAPQAFLDRVLEDYRPGELPEIGDQAFGEALRSFWGWAGQKAGAGETRVRLTPLERDGVHVADLLEVTQPDAPLPGR